MLTTLLSAAALPALLTFTPQQLWQEWPRERFITTPAPCLRPAELAEHLHELARRHPGELTLEEAGRSVQGRPIYLMTLGHGERKVLLWSQMHGDEPSATPALLDLADYLLSHPDDPASETILQQTTLLMVPMLNPDGAEVYLRRNAQGIDINRDALSLATPEGRLLKSLRDEHQPMLGFNLHDQNRRTAVGDSGVLATNAVLAVAGDAEGTLTPGRLLAKRACAAIAETLAPFAPGGMARYDEDWSPRAFGDNLTAWGTPVVLIESGAVPPGGDFTDLTRLNFVALLTTLEELATDGLSGHDPEVYENLLRNQTDAWADVAVRGGDLLQPGTRQPYRADLAFNLAQDDRVDAGCLVLGTPEARLVELGDARFLGSSRNLDAEGALIVAPLTAEVLGWKARRWLNGQTLDRLTRAGIGLVRWQVSPRRLERARSLARNLEGPGRARLMAGTEAPAVPGLRLHGPPAESTSSSLDERLTAAAGESWVSLRRERSIYQTLLYLEGGRKDLADWPRIRRGFSPSFFLLSPFDRQASSLEGAEIRSLWLDGVEVLLP
ncbi:MAG: hypothetical protein KDD47_21000 [Acidobacteria bacterium]|nr:hypothetical protein [Acidobacteriota bacterium]